MKIHIMHILYSFGLGGLEIQIANLINNMDSESFSNSICIFSENTEAMAKISPKRNVIVYILKRRVGNDPLILIRLACLLRRHKPDIVRTYNWGGMDGIIAAKLAGIKNIVHSEHGFSIEEITKQKKRRILIRRFLLNFCTKIIAVSESLEAWLKNIVKIDSEKVLYIPNGCDLNRFKPGKNVEKRRLLGIEDNDIAIGTVGSLNKIKDQQTLIRAFARACLILKQPLKLLIVGDGPEKSLLEGLCDSLKIRGKVIFTGRIVDPVPFYQAMDIFVLTSLSENSPNALLEAMACGLFVIATNVGDVEKMLKGARGGLIVKKGDAEAIAMGIDYFFRNQAEANAKKSFVRKIAEEHFNFNNTTYKYLSLYSEIVNRRNSKQEN